ncbi:hypothetical protein [Endozoicomonas sp. SESOKO3]|uniref:hypothetical protein n=1 Tax=Endozoicomonas sp. SESOKO3 TaxID=2828744 RepID=UPI0021487FD6|nr:hypothetical protein [Endozoicomonas sp. SESOKO3]
MPVVTKKKILIFYVAITPMISFLIQVVSWPKATPFFLSTILKFEVNYWSLSLIRYKLYPQSPLNRNSRELIEMASLMTVGSIALKETYSSWPKQPVLERLLSTSGILSTVIWGTAIIEREITVESLIFLHLIVQAMTGTIIDMLSKFTIDIANIKIENICAHYEFFEVFLKLMSINVLLGLNVYEFLKFNNPDAFKRTLSCIAFLSILYVSTHTISDSIFASSTLLYNFNKAFLTSNLSIALVVVVIAFDVALEYRDITQNESVEIGCSAFLGAFAGNIIGALSRGAFFFEAADELDTSETALSLRAIIGMGVLVGVSTMLIMGGALAVSINGLVPTDGNENAHSVTVLKIGLVASLFALINSYAKFVDNGTPVDETLSKIGWGHWTRPYLTLHQIYDYLIQMTYPLEPDWE